MPAALPDFMAILQAFAAARVDFIVVGGISAALHGAPVTTFDLDCVYSRAPQNLARLDAALRTMGAAYREKPRVAPDASLLDGPGHHLLTTHFGPLDLLGSTVSGGYEELAAHTESVELESGQAVRIVDLPTLISMKEKLGRDRDAAALPILRKTLAERKAR